MDTNDEEHPVHEFGWWPEIVGAIAVIVLVWALIAFARGSI
jgi:hypothetical protein